LIVPMIFTPDDARKAAAAVAYPPHGVRGIGSALARSGAWGRYANYLTTARETITLIIQRATAEAPAHIDDILHVAGIEGGCRGPSDVSASVGDLRQESHPGVVGGATSVSTTAQAAGKVPAGNAFNPAGAAAYGGAGAGCGRVAAAVGLLARGAEQLAAEW